MRILLIAGGWSGEREVSLSGARAIQRALEEIGHEVIPFDPRDELPHLPQKARKVDFAFINLHGSPGEDGLIQAMLDTIGCPYQGSGPGGSLLALNKACAKILFEEAGVSTPAWEFLPVPPPNSWEPSISYPMVVKPNSGGSSIDIEMVENFSQLKRAMDTIFSKGEEVLLEEQIKGKEITCGILGNKALPPVLIEPASQSTFFDYHSKYTAGAAREICPAPISEELTSQIQETALVCHRILGLDGYSRTDFILKGNKFFVLEVNTLPGMTATSLLPQEASAIGYSFKELLSALIKLGLNKKSMP